MDTSLQTAALRTPLPNVTLVCVPGHATSPLLGSEIINTLRFPAAEPGDAHRCSVPRPKEKETFPTKLNCGCDLVGTPPSPRVAVTGEIFLNRPP